MNSGTSQTGRLREENKFEELIEIPAKGEVKRLDKTLAIKGLPLEKKKKN